MSENADNPAYEPSTWDWVADQVTEYEASGGERANTLMETGIPIIVTTMLGHKSGKTRKVPLMRVEHDGEYALIASKAGMPHHPGWYHNLAAATGAQIQLQDGPAAADFAVREVTGTERDDWYARGVSVYPEYADYATSAGEFGRTIPVFVASPLS